MDAYPITTKELLIIAAKEIGKRLPIAGALIGAHEAVFSSLEMNRVKAVLEDALQRLDRIEKKTGVAQVFDAKSTAVLVYAADQVRSDILADSKKSEYGSTIAHYVRQPDDFNEVFEVLDCLRKLSAGDLKVLYHFWLGGEFFDNRLVAELAGHTRYTDPFQLQEIVRKNMETLYPSLMRLEALGVIYLSHGHSGAGEMFVDIGGLSEHLKKFAFLTEAGKRLVKVLPK